MCRSGDVFLTGIQKEYLLEGLEQLIAEAEEALRCAYEGPGLENTAEAYLEEICNAQERLQTFIEIREALSDQSA